MVEKTDFLRRLMSASSARGNPREEQHVEALYSLAYDDIRRAGMAVVDASPREEAQSFNRPEHPGRQYYGPGDLDWEPF
mgnify:FL=1